jgi:hypothetical protein
VPQSLPIGSHIAINTNGRVGWLCTHVSNS